MKLTSLNDKSRDGKLIIVSRDLTKAVDASKIATTMQVALDNWSEVANELALLYQKLNEGKVTSCFQFDPKRVYAPLPRAYQWADGSAYVNHIELVRKARGAEMPDNFWVDPLLYQGGSDKLSGPQDDVLVADEAYGIDFEAEIGVITHEVVMGCTKEQAKHSILLLVLINDVSLRNLIPAEIAKGFGFFNSKPATAFSPVAITPDELGKHWDGYKVNLPLRSYLNGQLFGQPNAGEDMTFDFPTLISHAAKTRFLSAGTIIGSGTVSNRDRSKGSSCIAEKRMLELLATGETKTPFMQFGDNIKIEMLDEKGDSLFGAIEQQVVQYVNPI